MTPELGSMAVNLDWVRYTVPWEITDLFEWERKPPTKLLQRALELATMGIEPFRPTGEELRPRHNYNRCYGMLAGSLSFHTEMPQQKIMIDLPGAACAAYRDKGITDHDVLDFLKQRGAKLTRLDVALDYYGEGNPLDIRDAHRRGATSTAIRNTTEVVERNQSGALGGTTVYFGSAQSDRRIRIYDKRAQMQTDYPWLRIEATLKGDAATIGLNAIASRDIGNAGRAIIRSIVDTKAVQWWTKAMTGDLIQLEPLGRKETDTDKWLMGVVRDNLERRLNEQLSEDDYTLYDAFLATLEIARKKKHGD